MYYYIYSYTFEAMKELTHAEEQVMQYLWKLEKAFLKDIVDEYPEPKPAYTTISTVIRVLVKKGFIGFDQFGKTNRYFPKISKSSYSKATFKGVFQKFFDSSPTMFTSFFTKEEKISVDELEEMKQIIEEELKKKKNDGKQ